MYQLSTIILILLSAYLLTACKRDEITYYEIPKEERPTSSVARLPDQPPITAETPQISWTLPAGWQSGNPSSIRVGSFAVEGPEGQRVDISVTTFPGDVGGVLLNINRWRRQIGLPPITDDLIGFFTTDLEINGKACRLIDLIGEAPPPGKTWPQRSLVATVVHNDNSWFFKMTGDALLVETQREAYLAFLESVRF